MGRTYETKMEQTLCMRAYAKAKGSEAAGLLLCPTLGFLSHKAVHTVSHTTKTGTLGPGLRWLLGTAVSILCVTDTWVKFYLQGPPRLKTVYTKNSLLSLSEPSENNC